RGCLAQCRFEERSAPAYQAGEQARNETHGRRRQVLAYHGGGLGRCAGTLSEDAWMTQEVDNEERAAGEERQVVLNTKPLFKLMVDKLASDLFFTSYAPIKIKIEGQIFPVNKQMLTPEVVRQAAYGLMTQEQIEAFNEELEIDFAISEPGLGRFRVNVFHQRGNPAMVLRYITADMPRLEDLGLPEILKDLMMLKRGLILMVGATGSGKSTTLAAM